MRAASVHPFSHVSLFRRRALGILVLTASASVGAQSISGFSPHGGRSQPVVISGAGLSGTTSVQFGGSPAAAFVVDSDTQITAAAPASFASGPVSVSDGIVTTASLFHYVSRPAGMAIVGPVGKSALPLGVLYNYSPLADNAFGQPGGVNYMFENMSLPANTWVYFGVSGPIGISMDNNAPSGPEIMNYSAADSNLSGGLIVFRGTSQMNLAAPWPPGNQVCTRLRLQFQPYAPSALVPVISAADAGLPAALGAVAAIPPGTKFRLNLAMEAAYTSGGCNTWQPALQLYDQAPTIAGQLAYSNYGTGFYYENTAPELGAVADQVVSDGGATPALALSVADAETTADFVVLSATSSDTTFVPESNIAFGGAGAARTVTVTTVAGAPGPATITLRGTDSAGVFSEQTFVVAKNTAPTISDVADQLVQVGEPTPALAFTIADAETATAALSVSASSNNQTLLPDANLVLGGSDGTRNVTATPFGSQTGQATVTLTVTDEGGLSVSDSFVVTVNAKPVLTTNVAASVQQGQSVTLTSANLNTSDVESSAAEIRYTLNPDGSGTAGRAGAVRLSGTPLGDGGTFTQQDINDGLVTFLHDDSCETAAEFNFDIDDGDGGYGRAPLSPYRAGVTVTLRNDPPIANALALNAPLGGTVTSAVSATDGDCLGDDIVSYTHVAASGPSKGTITAFDSATGAFTYVATGGQSGADSFQFEASDGTHTVTGTVSIMIENQAPQAQSAAFTAEERTAVQGVLVATDSDLPAQSLSFAIASPPGKGSVSGLDAATGAFTYTPDPNRIGEDSFTFTVDDGTATSAPATIDVTIRPRVDPGDIVVGDSQNTMSGTQGTVVFVDPVSGDRFLLSAAPELSGTEVQGVAFEADGDVIAAGSNGNLYRIDPATGAATLITSIGGLALGVRVDLDGSLLVAAGPAGIKRIDPVTGAVLATYTGTTLAVASDVDLMADGRIVVTDAAAAFGPGTNKLLIIDPSDNSEVDTGATGFVLPLSVARLADGRIAVGDGLSEFGSPSSAVIVVDPSDGSTDANITGALVDGVTGLDVDAAGNVYAVSRVPNQVLGVDVAGAGVASVSTSAPLRKPWGLAVYGGRGADLGIAKDNQRLGLLDGEVVTYAIVVENNGPDPIRGAALADSLPASLLNGSWTCRQDVSSAICPMPSSGPGNLSAAVDLGVGEHLRFDLSAEVDGVVNAFVANTATIAAPQGSPDQNNANNSATDQDPIVPVGIFSDGFETVGSGLQSAAAKSTLAK